MTVIGTNVPRWVLKHDCKGYLIDDRADVLQFCAHPNDARQFFIKRIAERVARTYKLQIIDYPNYLRQHPQARSAKAGSA